MINSFSSVAGAELLEPVQPYVERVVADLDELPRDRRELLDPIAAVVRERLESGEKAHLTFICTHNSRRSHLAQVWADVAAAYYGLAGVQTYSGGTEATACNVRTVRALRRAGLSVVRSAEGENPVYLVQYSELCPPIHAFSKVYNQQGNPTSDYIAVMCCDDADRGCPTVAGSAVRFALHYRDPKAADDTPEETASYDQRCLQIAQEMFYLLRESSVRQAR